METIRTTETIETTDERDTLVLQELAAFRDFLESAALDDRVAFHCAIKEAQKVFRISQPELAELFAFSTATVNRWSNGQGAPYPGLRKVIFEKLAQRADMLRRSLQRHATKNVISIEKHSHKRRRNSRVDNAA